MCTPEAMSFGEGSAVQVIEVSFKDHTVEHGTRRE
jgi:hypothetical protein